MSTSMRGSLMCAVLLSATLFSLTQSKPQAVVELVHTVCNNHNGCVDCDNLLEKCPEQFWHCRLFQFMSVFEILKSDSTKCWLCVLVGLYNMS